MTAQVNSSPILAFAIHVPVFDHSADAPGTASPAEGEEKVPPLVSLSLHTVLCCASSTARVNLISVLRKRRSSWANWTGKKRPKEVDIGSMARADEANAAFSLLTTDSPHYQPLIGGATPHIHLDAERQQHVVVITKRLFRSTSLRECKVVFNHVIQHPLKTCSQTAVLRASFHMQSSQDLI